MNLPFLPVDPDRMLTTYACPAFSDGMLLL